MDLGRKPTYLMHIRLKVRLDFYAHCDEMCSLGVWHKQSYACRPSDLAALRGLSRSLTLSQSRCSFLCILTLQFCRIYLYNHIPASYVC